MRFPFAKATPGKANHGRVQRDSRIKLRIPAGVDTGTRLRSSGHGDAGVRGGESGDLYVFLHVRDHDVFERDGADLFCEVPLPFSIAALGGELKVPCLDGRSSIKIPAGTQGGTVFRLRDRGVKDWGRMIEGHGGMLDRLDSVIFAAPVFFHLTRFWFVP